MRDERPGVSANFIRGCLIAMLLSVPFWIAIGFIIWWLLN